VVSIMKLNIRVLYIECMVCSSRVSIRDAEKLEWRKCRICGGFICPDCLELVLREMNGVCPSSIYMGFKPHKMELDEISAQEILILAKEIYSRGRVGPIIKEVFYSDPLTVQFEALTFRKKKAKKRDEAEVREEIWRRYGLVLVKRARGKFVTWEPIT